MRDGVSAIDRALKIRPTSHEAHYNLAHGWQELKDWGKALSSIEQAIALRPDKAVYQFEHGNILRNTNRFAEALADGFIKPAQSALQLDSCPCRSILQSGQCAG